MLLLQWPGHAATGRSVIPLLAIAAIVCAPAFFDILSTLQIWTRLGHECIADAFTVWDDYRTCLVSYHSSGVPCSSSSSSGSSNRTDEDCFHNLLLEQFHVPPEHDPDSTLAGAAPAPAAAPWHRPSSCAILLEFRPIKDRLRWSIANALDNLPVSWCVQVVGSPAVLEAVNASFPVEVAVSKIRLLDMGDGSEMTQESISTVLTDRAFYDKLLGDTWLFFQLDSAICKRQRHFLRDFVDKGYGWWGAPWRYSWPHWPFFCGNGGLSLRHRRFMNDVLNRFARESNSTVNEDVWLCGRAAELVAQQQSTTATEEQPPSLSMVPAPHYESMQFSVETEMHTRPFGVHQFWFHHPPNYELRALFEACPEALEIVPKPSCDHWASVVCAADVNRTALMPATECDWAMCERALSPEGAGHPAGVLYTA